MIFVIGRKYTYALIVKSYVPNRLARRGIIMQRPTMCNTVEQLHPFQSTRDVDGVYGDRETVQNIAFDGETFEAKKRTCNTKPLKTANGHKSPVG